MTATVATIETDALTKSYGPGRGIHELTIGVEPGEVFGFLGPNGAGKTTTIRTLLDLLHPTSGSARIFGLDSRRDSVAIRRRVGNLPGDFGFGRASTGRQALELLTRLRGGIGLARAEALASRFAADLDRPLGQLSRGNRQKVGLILATFHSPDLLIVDEPTTGLDPLMQEEFLALVTEERARGATVFFSSHDLAEVERVCDRVAIIREARLVTVEKVETLLERSQRRFVVDCAGGDPRLAELASLPGVAHFELAGSTARFTFSGELDPLIARIGELHVRDLQASRPTLEEVFLAYYAPGAEHDR